MLYELRERARQACLALRGRAPAARRRAGHAGEYTGVHQALAEVQAARGCATEHGELATLAALEAGLLRRLAELDGLLRGPA